MKLLEEIMGLAGEVFKSGLEIMEREVFPGRLLSSLWIAPRAGFTRERYCRYRQTGNR